MHILINSGANMANRPLVWWLRLSTIWALVLLLCSFSILSSFVIATTHMQNVDLVIEGNSSNVQTNLEINSVNPDAIDQPEQLTSRTTEPDWPMFGKDSSHSHTANTVQRGIYESTIKWDIWPEGISNSRIDSWGSTIGNFTANIDWKGSLERNVNHLVYAENGFINILDGGSGEFVWRLDVDLIDGTLDNDLVYSTPALGYFDADSQLDMTFCTTDGNIYVYEPQSSYFESTGYENSTDNANLDKVWSYPTGENLSQSSPVLQFFLFLQYPSVIFLLPFKLFLLQYCL